MLSINTNLSSLIAQSSLKSSTQLLNQAVERMTTGYKINGAKDNAANYSISTNMNTQLSAYDVAADNVAMGMDLVTTASDIISMMQDKASRLHALSTQARNGTYGGKSIDTLNTEAGAIMAEITRLYMTSEYNGISLFDRKAYTIAPHLPQAGPSGFIDETAIVGTEAPIAKAEYNGFIADPKTYTDAEVAAMTALTDAVTSVSSGQKYSISSDDELENLAQLVNSGKDTTGAIFVLGADIDLKDYENWTPIGDYSKDSSYEFKGTFDGNGHVIKNLKINRNSKYQGLFGSTSGTSELKNIGIVNCNIVGAGSVGALAGNSTSKLISNCYSIGEIESTADSGHNSEAGGLVGRFCGEIYNETYLIENSYSSCNVKNNYYDAGGLFGSISKGPPCYVYIKNSYATGIVIGATTVGGFAGTANVDSISVCYATGNVEGVDYVGGLLGSSTATITNSYATGIVSGTSQVGGLAGLSTGGSITNSYATGTVSGTSQVGGLAGLSTGGSITNSYATGDVWGVDYVAGLIGDVECVIIENSFATGNVTGVYYVSGLIGWTYEDDSSHVELLNSYATGNIVGEKFVGGLVGYVETCYEPYDTFIISDCTSYSQVISGEEAVGSIIGGWVGEEISGYYTSGVISMTNNSAISTLQGVGAYYTYDEDNDVCAQDLTYDLSSYNNSVALVPLKQIMTSLQVGINSDISNQINFDTNFDLNINAINIGIETEGALNAINDFLTLLNDKSTMLGAIENKLNSALDSIEVNINNLTSSLSTIRDADIAEVSSHYIQQQILQQASATLLATANQSPSIALQLI